MNTDYDYLGARLMLTFFKILGLAPFVVKRSPISNLTKRRNLKIFAPNQYSPSRFGCLYNLLLIIVQFGVLFKAIPNAYSDIYPNASTIITSFEVSASVVGNSALLTIYLIHAFRQKTTTRLLNRLSSVDSAIMKTNNDDKTYDSCNIFFIIVLLINIVVWIGNLTSAAISFKLPFVSTFRIEWPSTIIALFVTQYIFVIKLIYNRLRYFNQVVLEKSVFFLSENHRSSVVNELSFNYCATSKIVYVRRIHVNLYQIATEVSKFYSLPILFAIAHFCYIFIYNSYYFILPFVITTEKYSGLVVANSVLWIVGSMLPIVMLSSKITDLNVEMKKTADIVNKLLIRPKLNEFDRIELKLFALELMHRKVRFVACGLFSLDNTLVHSILSMVTTYLIILIQHQMGRSETTTQQQTSDSTNVKNYPTGYNGV